MERRINPAEAGMEITARSTGAFKIIEDERGMETKAIPLEESEPLGSDAEYLKEIEDEKKAEAERRRLEDLELYALEHPNAPVIKSVMKNRPATKTVIAENTVKKVVETPVKEEKVIAQDAYVEEIKEIPKKSEIEAQYEKDMAEINERIAKLQKETKANKEPAKIVEVKPADNVIIKAKPTITKVNKVVTPTSPISSAEDSELLKRNMILEASNKSLTDAVVTYQNKVTISELKANYKIQLLTKQIVANADEETTGKILSKFYKYLNENESTDNMLSIK